MRVVSWNMRRASRQSTEAWHYLFDLKSDLVLLQEVNSFPDEVTADYQILFRKAIGKTGRPQPFGTAILAKGTVLEEIHCSTEWEWVNEELSHFEGCFVTATVELAGGVRFHVMSVHCSAWPIDKHRLKDVDVTEVKLLETPQLVEIKCFL